MLHLDCAHTSHATTASSPISPHTTFITLTIASGASCRTRARDSVGRATIKLTGAMNAICSSATVSG